MSKRTSFVLRATQVVSIILLALAAIFIIASQYKQAQFGGSKFDEIVFYIRNGMGDGRSENFQLAALQHLPWAIGLCILFLLPLIDRFRRAVYRVGRAIGRRLRRRSSSPAAEAAPSRSASRRYFRWRYKFLYASLIFLASGWYLLQTFEVPAYIQALTQSTKLYETHYVDPKTAHLTFPAKKRNLVYIYMESMENSLLSKAHGGQADSPIIPELEQIALHHTNFSHTQSGIGGALPATGTTWTVGGMAAQSGGVPLKETFAGGRDHNSLGDFDKFLPGAYTSGDIFKQQGYNQTFIMGSSAKFGGRDKLLSQHGSYQIQDYQYALDHKQLPSANYKVWWGYEDKKLFTFARQEATRLAEQDKPFNLQLLTADTHFTDGYLDETCKTPHQQQYDNVYACSSKQVAEFVKWLQQQPFAANTTIVLSGDHLGMQTDYYQKKITSPTFQRTVYHAFINPAVTPTNSHNRLFSTMDMYPSTLAALGVTIKGERLGLGTNLFSTKKTLVEELGGIDQLNAELAKRSSYYERRIISH